MIAQRAVKPIMTAEEYDQAASAYCESLPLEHFMERTTQSTQRAITDASFALVRRRRSDVHCFGELLVQYIHSGRLRQVVPDNMVVKGPLDERERGSFPLEHEASPPFWMMEYVSEENKRKDYVDSFQKYERELNVPYYLIFDPDEQDLRLHRLDGDRYVLVEANTEGRHPVPELDLEVGLLDRWVRFWYQGVLMPIPVELDEQREHLEKQLERKGKQLRSKEKQLQRKDEQLQRKDEQLLGMVEALRPLVKEKAERAGRKDILEQLGTDDGTLLARWLRELP